MLLAVQRLRVMSNGGSLLARWTVGYYIITTLVSITLSCLMMGLVWTKLYRPVSQDQLEYDDSDSTVDTSEQEIYDVILDMFESFIPSNVVYALANDDLLAGMSNSSLDPSRG